MPKTHYEILEIENDAVDTDIKKAYRKLILKFHPDKALLSGIDLKIAEETCKVVISAYETLSNPEKRHQYDLSLTWNKFSRPAGGAGEAATEKNTHWDASFFTYHRQAERAPIDPVIYPIKLNKKWSDLVEADDIKQLDEALNAEITFEKDLLETLLYQACKNGKLNLAIYLIESRKVNPKLLINDDLRFTGAIFKAAAESGNLALVKYLLEIHHVDIESQGLSAGTKSTALSRAAKLGHVDVVAYLIASGANVNPNVSYSDILDQAIYSGKLSVVQMLIEAGTKIDDFNLEKAFIAGNIEIVQYILRQRPAIDKHLFTNSPGYSAMLSGNVALVRYLEQHESLDIFLPSKSYHSRKHVNLQLISAAGQSGCVEMLRYLLEVKGLIKECVLSDTAEEYRYTALKSSLDGTIYFEKKISVQDRVNILRYLMEELRLGLSPEGLKKFIEEVMQTSPIELVAYMQSYLTDSAEPRRLLLLIAEKGLNELTSVELFRTYNLKSMKENYRHSGNIHSAIVHRHLTNEQLIECAGANDQFKLDALFYYAIESYHIGYSLSPIKIILSLGIDINAENPEGELAVQCAFRVAGYSEIVKHLIENGADIYRKDKNGQSVFDRLKHRPDFMEQIEKLTKIPGENPCCKASPF
jgi:ankyrin repeat protein